MNILLVTDLYPLNDTHRGIPKTIENFALSFCELGHKVTVLRADLVLNTLLRGRRIYPEKTYFRNGIKIYNKNFLLPFYFGLDFLKNEDFDVIISHMPSGSLCGAKIKKKFKKPHAAIVHSSDIEVLEKYKFFFSGALKSALKNADITGARSIWLRERLGLKNTFLAPSGIKKEEIIPRNEALEKFDNIKTLKIITAASFIKRKNINLLIDAIKELDMPDITLKIFGGGREERALKKEARGLNIEFAGQKPRSEVLEEMRRSHVFILPSAKETFGLSYLEALASGCITVCSEKSGLDGWICNLKNGFTIKPETNDIKRVIKTIRKMSTEQMKEMSKNALKTADELEYYKCAENYLENIKKIL